MKRYTCFSIILFLMLFVFSSCDSPSGSKPETITKPSLVSPTDNAPNVSLTPTLTWSGSADVLEIGINPNFSPPLVYTANVSGQSQTVPSGKLTKNTRYYWHAGKTSGTDVYWSDEKFSFITAP